MNGACIRMNLKWSVLRLTERGNSHQCVIAWFETAFLEENVIFKAILIQNILIIWFSSKLPFIKPTTIIKIKKLSKKLQKGFKTRICSIVFINFTTLGRVVYWEKKERSNGNVSQFEFHTDHSKCRKQNIINGKMKL